MIDAPPSLQREYLTPLLLESGFTPGSELGYRMVFDVKGTKEWLTRIIDAPAASLEKQATRDAELMDAFWEKTRTAHSASERTGQLLASPGLSHAFRIEDVARLHEWLPLLRQALGRQANTYRSTQFLDGDYAKALRLFSRFGRCKDVRELFDVWRVDAAGIGPHEFARDLLRFPWFQWALTEPEDVADWLDSIANSGLSALRAGRDGTTGDDAASRVRAQMGDDLLVFAVYTMLAELQASAPQLVGDALRQKLLDFTGQIHGTPLASDNPWEVRRAGYLIEQALYPAEGASAARVERWTQADGWENPDSRDRRELRWSLIWDALGDGVAPRDPALLDALAALWREVENDEKWDVEERWYSRNPHHADPLVRFLVTGIQFLPDAREKLAPRLLRILAAAPGELIHTAALFSASKWGASWGAFVARVLTSAGGAASLAIEDGFDEGAGTTTAHQIGAINLWAEHSRLVREGTLPATSEDAQPLLQSLRSAAMLAISDERTLLANHAAYALVSAAEMVEDPGSAALLASALGRLSADTRVIVRMAAAYASGRLPILARSEQIREAAKMDPEQDPNAWVAAQRALGTLQAERERKKRTGAG